MLSLSARFPRTTIAALDQELVAVQNAVSHLTAAYYIHGDFIEELRMFRRAERLLKRKIRKAEAAYRREHANKGERFYTWDAWAHLTPEHEEGDMWEDDTDSQVESRHYRGLSYEALVYGHCHEAEAA